MKSPQEVERLLDIERAELGRSTRRYAMVALVARIEALEWVLERSDEADYDGDELDELGPSRLA